MNRTFGRRPALDERDHPMRMALAPRVTPAPRFHYWHTAPALDQGALPQCVGYAWRGWMLASPTRTHDGPSPADIYGAAQMVDEWPGEGYDGTSVRAGAKVLASHGRIGEYVFATDEPTLRQWVLTRGTVVMGTNWHTGMSDLSPGAIARPLGPVLGGHAYLCVGYSSLRGAYRFLNSWGLSFGVRGKFWILAEDVERLLREDGEACAAIERVPEEAS